MLQDKFVEALVLRRSNLRITDKAVGFVLARSVLDEAEILTIAVDPDHQKSGGGKQLIAGNDPASLWQSRCQTVSGS